MKEPDCRKCGHTRAPNKHGRYRKQNAFTRGLCALCYSLANKAKTLDQWALPSAPHANTRKMWSRVLSPSGYITIKTPDGIIAEHRHMMQQALGRALVDGENVHHINGMRGDNSTQNLELWYSPQPAGQRVQQLIAYMAEFHADAILSAISEREHERPTPDEVKAEQWAHLAKYYAGIDTTRKDTP